MAAIIRVAASGLELQRLPRTPPPPPPGSLEAGGGRGANTRTGECEVGCVRNACVGGEWMCEIEIGMF